MLHVTRKMPIIYQYQKLAQKSEKSFARCDNRSKLQTKQYRHFPLYPNLFMTMSNYKHHRKNTVNNEYRTISFQK